MTTAAHTILAIVTAIIMVVLVAKVLFAGESYQGNSGGACDRDGAPVVPNEHDDERDAGEVTGGGVYYEDDYYAPPRRVIVQRPVIVERTSSLVPFGLGALFGGLLGGVGRRPGYYGRPGYHRRPVYRGHRGGVRRRWG